MDAKTFAGQRAVVIGASIGGLLAARILQEFYSEVVLLERDLLSEGPASRKATPHAVLPQGLLAKGREVLESLFPDFTESLVAKGGLCGDIGQEVAVDANGERFAAQPAGIIGLAVSRLALEAELRRRVRALPGVRLITQVDVLSPIHEVGKVVGVRYEPRDGGQPSTLPGALVVDCSGRSSRSPTWLAEWGYEPPIEERVQIGLAYTSAYFEREEVRPALAAVIGAATPSLPRPSILLAQEPATEGGQLRWVAGVGGYEGDHVETTREAIARRAREINSPEIAALAENGTMIGKPIQYCMPYSERRHYEKLRRFPAGYLALGDALASFNPIYGQGMTVATCEALALREALKIGIDGLAPRFFKAAAKVIDIPWQVSVGADLALEQVPGPRPFPVNLINAYVGRVQRAAVQDPTVAAAFMKVMHMVAPPPSLFAPAIAWRVLKGVRAGAATRQTSLGHVAH
jgi:2-polyprenyl-6-methoxyphenol hydroxylase-like FAD-dependent oxidoreductase